jgi:hypothetical protein
LQLAQLVWAFPAAILPPAQVLQAEVPAALAYRPAAQLTQLDAPAEGW